MSRVFLLGMLLLLGGCSSAPPATVEERSTRPARAALEADGRYRVRRGDTLFGIAFSYGLDYRDVARWNNISSPYVIYPDQLLRLQARSRTTQVKTKPAKPVPEVKKAPAESKPVTPARSSGTAPATRPASVNTPPPTDPTAWVWPTKGRLMKTFSASDPSRKGIEIAGTQGQSVVAVAAGTVVYSGSGLIGYGELIIIKHSETLLSAYAHNRKRLVQEGAVIKTGQKISEMGRKDSKNALLHFEIRQNGKPVDPLKYLPKQ
jgi:lipoprotein NlpD